jgi:hypothetical protein
VNCQFHRADVTDLAFLADPFELALDTGCLHGLPSGPSSGCSSIIPGIDLG